MFINFRLGSTDPGFVKYQEADYKAAIEIWKNNFNTDSKNDKLAYNIANSYYELKNYPESIFWYYKSLSINPYNKDSKHNLELVQSLAGIDEFNLPGFKTKSFLDSVVYFMNPLLYIFLYALCTVLGILLWKRKASKLVIYSLWSLSVFFLSLTVIRYSDKRFKDEAIVMKNCSLHISPDSQSESRQEIMAGEKIKILDLIDDWYKIRTSSYDQGWIQCEFRNISQ